MVRFNFCRNEIAKRQKISLILIITMLAILCISSLFAALLGNCGSDDIADCNTVTASQNITSASDDNVDCNTVTASQNATSAYAIMAADRFVLLGGNNASTKLPMASTTKIMTAYLATKSGKLNDIVTIPQAAVGVEGSSVYLQKGERYKLIDLVYGLMLQSGNDAATAIALYLGGSVQNFAAMMNAEAKNMGLKSTNFVNPHGLHDDNHYTSAYDLAFITCKALENKDFAEVCSTKCHKFQTIDGENKCYINKNKLLNQYDGAIGVKTGYTKKAGRCLVSAACRGGVKIVSVVLNQYDMWNQSMANLDKGFALTQAVTLAEGGKVIAEIKTSSGQLLRLGVINDINYTALKNQKLNISYEIQLDKNLPKTINKGAAVGKIIFYERKHLLFSQKIYNI